MDKHLLTVEGREYIEISYSEECSNWFRNFRAGDITKLEQFLSISGSYTPFSGFRLVYACKVAKNQIPILFQKLRQNYPGLNRWRNFLPLRFHHLTWPFLYMVLAEILSLISEIGVLTRGSLPPNVPEIPVKFDYSRRISRPQEVPYFRPVPLIKN